jgi:3-phenylpropionate/trans-cinnamate dioxygenase ferredoxin reductase subunit
MSSFVIVGAGQAGCSAAMELRRARFGGRIVMVGDEPHLPYERPPLSKGVLSGGVGSVPLLQAPDRYAREGIETLCGVRVDALDTASRSVRLSDGSTLDFDALLLATGGRARRLTIPGGHHALSLRSFDDAVRLHERLRRPGHLTVVGAGVIGLEVAASARALGWDVTVLEAAERPLARLLPGDVAAFVADVHRQAGVVLRFGTSVQAIEAARDGRWNVVCEHGVVVTDLVVAGVGMQPHIELATQAGIATDGAIVVDEHGRTSAPGIHAAGDATSFWQPSLRRRMRLESWQHAARHAAAVARNMMGQVSPYDEVAWSWTDQHDLNLQVLGQPLDGDETVLRGDMAARRFVTLHLAAGRLVGATLVNQGREMRPCKALIESGVPLDAMQLADPSVVLRSLAASVSTPSVVPA